MRAHLHKLVDDGSVRERGEVYEASSRGPREITP
jgi:hypothetical protein